MSGGLTDVYLIKDMETVNLSADPLWRKRKEERRTGAGWDAFCRTVTVPSVALTVQVRIRAGPPTCFPPLPLC